MGLYDYINGEQIKIFYHPIFDESSKDTWHSGGSMVGYNTGEQVPIKTFYYNRPKNFIVFDENEYQNNPLLHIIRDSVVFNTISLKDATDDVFIDNTLVLNYYGYELNIKSTEDCYKFMEESNKYEEEQRDVNKPTYNLFHNKIIPLHWIISHIDYSETINKLRPDRSSKLKIVFQGIEALTEIQKILEENFSFKSLQEFKDSLITNDDLYNNFVEIILPIAKAKYEQYNKEYDKLKTEIKPLSDKLSKEYYSKHYIESPYKEEAQFGEYIECLRYMYHDRDQEGIPHLASNRSRYDALIEAITDFLNTHNNIVDSYIKWLELDDVQAQNIKSICEGILTNPNDLPVKHLQDIYIEFYKNIKTDIELDLDIDI